MQDTTLYKFTVYVEWDEASFVLKKRRSTVVTETPSQRIDLYCMEDEVEELVTTIMERELAKLPQGDRMMLQFRLELNLYNVESYNWNPYSWRIAQVLKKKELTASEAWDNIPLGRFKKYWEQA